MPNLVRNDGTPFCVYTFRETLSTRNPSALRREVTLISRENGTYVRLFQLEHEVEAVFSFDKGYLLAELIWSHFGHPMDMIYCEALEDNQNAILIIVRGGSVYLDAYLPITNLLDEFASLTHDNQYQIYVAGNVPLAELATDQHFAFEPEMVESFITLDTPVFPTLAVDEAYRLLPLEEALNEYTPAKSLPIKAIIIVLVLAIAGYFGWQSMSKQPTQVVIAPTVQKITNVVAPPKNTFANFQTALATPAPSDILLAVLNAVTLVQTIPGWNASTMTYKDNGLTFTLSSVGGDMGMLVSWSKEYHIPITTFATQAMVTFPLNVPNRPAPTIIYPLQDIGSTLYDNLQKIFPTVTITAASNNDGGKTTPDNYKQISLSISYDSISPAILALLAKQLRNYPIYLQSMALTINQGLLSGTIQLQVLGA